MNERSRYWSRAVAGLLAWLVCGVAARSTAQPTAPATPESGATAAEGGDLGDLESLLGESVVTTASRSSERASTAPSTVYTITAEELRIFGIRSFDEALGYLGLGVYAASARDYTSGGEVGAQGVPRRRSVRRVQQPATTLAAEPARAHAARSGSSPPTGRSRATPGRRPTCCRHRRHRRHDFAAGRLHQPLLTFSDAFTRS